MKSIFKKIFPGLAIKSVEMTKSYLLDGYAQESYSQEGEDMILRRFFEHQGTGFYIDVGAHHPKRFSNTYFFYKQGWKGINIDAMPGSMKLFNKYRPRDINIEKPVSDQKQVLTYYGFNEPALNGFSKELSESRDGLANYKIIFQKDLETSTLSNILDENLPKNQLIDFLSIDVEGLDLVVLKSNDWEKYAPRVVLVEVLRSSLSMLECNEITNFLKQFNYEIYAKCVNTVLFKKCQ